MSAIRRALCGLVAAAFVAMAIGCGSGSPTKAGDGGPQDYKGSKAGPPGAAPKDPAKE